MRHILIKLQHYGNDVDKDVYVLFFVFFQVGNLVGLCLMEERCLIMTLKKMPGKDARAALKFQFVKSKVSIVHLLLLSVLQFYLVLTL